MPADRPIFEVATRSAWRVLADEPGRELVLGARATVALARRRHARG